MFALSVKKSRVRPVGLAEPEAGRVLPRPLRRVIRFCASFLDQGFGNWQLPLRERGFFESFCALYGTTGGPPDTWLRGLPDELERLLPAEEGVDDENVEAAVEPGAKSANGHRKAVREPAGRRYGILQRLASRRMEKRDQRKPAIRRTIG